MMLTVYTLFALDLVGISLSFGVAQAHVLSLGGSLYYVGILTSMAAVLSFLWTPIAGRFSDTRDPREVMIWCLSASAFGNLATGTSPTLYLLTISRMIQVLGMPLQGVLRSTLTTFKNEDRSAMMNKLGIITSASLIVGSLGGGFLSEFVNGITYRYYLMAFLNLVCMVLVKRLPAKPVQKEKSDGSNTVEKATKEIKEALKSMAGFFVSERYGDLFFVKTILECVVQFRLTALLYQFNVELAFTGRQIGYIIATMFLWNIFVNVVLLKATKKLYPEDKGSKRVLHACIITVVSMTGQSLSQGVLPSIFFLLLGEISNAVVEAATMELFLERVDEKEKGVATNSFGSVRSISELIAPLACNTCLGKFGGAATFLGGGVLATGAAVVCARKLGGDGQRAKKRTE